MKKYILLCSLALMCASESVGKPSDAEKTEKVLFVDDHMVTVIDFASLDLTLIEVKGFEYSFGNSYTLTTVFINSEPLGIELFRKGELVPYKQNGQLKAKFHSEHLFNPVKRC